MISKTIFLSLLVSIYLINSIGCPPVLPDQQAKKEEAHVEEEKKDDDPILNLEYHRYLKEVVNLLESDNKFKELIEKASPEDIKVKQQRGLSIYN